MFLSQLFEGIRELPLHRRHFVVSLAFWCGLGLFRGDGDLFVCVSLLGCFGLFFLESFLVRLEDDGVGQYGHRPRHFVARPAGEAFSLGIPEWCEVRVELCDVGIGEELCVCPAEDASCVWGEVRGSDLLSDLSSGRGICWERRLDGVGEGC